MTSREPPTDRSHTPEQGRMKRRRVKTGCYTCRERRVKCDESRPACEKCRRGKRECEYPCRSSSSTKQPSPPALPVVEDYGPTKDLLATVNFRRGPINTGIFLATTKMWSEVSQEMRCFLHYIDEHMSSIHFSVRVDPTNFFSNPFLRMMLSDESPALLNAAIAYAVFLSSFPNNKTNITFWLEYYNKSITFLAQSLAGGHRTIATLATILQLATLEHLFGDWARTASHLKAAREILLELFTPDTIVKNEDSHNEDLTSLDREWHVALADTCKEIARNDPSDLDVRIEAFSAAELQLAADIKSLLRSKRRHEMSDKTFQSKADRLWEEFKAFQEFVERSSSSGPSSFAKTYPMAPPPSDDDIVNYRDECFLLAGELFPINFIMMDLWLLEIRFKQQLAILMPSKYKNMASQVQEPAMNICKMFEAIEYCNESRPGSLKICADSLFAASLVIATDEKRINWCCRKYAVLERMGVIPCARWRDRVNDLWKRDVKYWWLPDEEPPVGILALRDFVEGREDMTELPGTKTRERGCLPASLIDLSACPGV
ncbi:Hypothetical protein R9X50_00221800 [Acrodontium crateriforme]|uniref:Zn(2)-C6 fungal-type domain-containing protein n=1 Tax=Acrodontium crateriforme TaxID=150365 RepID=A0AAQ3M227_9PEZI|nr:Hypothetical protein R9X50_00221800 [Acrodontium crateriforme]